MRVALFTMQESAVDAPGSLLGTLKIGGKSLARRQVEFALQAGCEKVICLAPRMLDETKSIQAHVEKAGGRFITLTSSRGLLGQVAADDELLVLADGLLPLHADAIGRMSDKPCVLTFDADGAVESGFERIDLNWAWAGAMVVPGALVERLAELPPDFDTVSALLRLALQGQLPMERLPDSWRDENDWILVRERRQLTELEPHWVSRRLPPRNFWAVTQAVSDTVALALSNRIVAHGGLSRFFLAGAIVFALAGAGVAASGYTIAAFALLFLSWCLGTAFRSVSHLESDVPVAQKSKKYIIINGLYIGLLDLSIVFIVALELPGDLLARLYLPLVCLGLVHVSAGLNRRTWGALLQDRGLLCLVLAAALATSQLAMALRLVSLLVLAAVLGFQIANSRITRA